MGLWLGGRCFNVGQQLVSVQQYQNQMHLESGSEVMNYPLFKDMVCKEDSATCAEQETIFDKYKVGRAHLLAPFRLFETNSSTSCDEGEDSDSKEDQKIRGPYRKYSYEEKMMAVDRILTGQDVKIISKESGIPRRNLLRWKKNGCERKEGGGRPTDSQMEAFIFGKIKNGDLTDQKEIRKFAVELSKTHSFKASKGWFVKFCHRYSIGQPQSQEDKENYPAGLLIPEL